MTWKVSYLPEAKKDYAALDGSQRLMVRKAVSRVAENPLPSNEGGYGKPLGKKGGKDLTGFLKIKLLRAGIRVVYKLMKTETGMLVVVIGAREDDEVYDMAVARAEKHGLM